MSIKYVYAVKHKDDNIRADSRSGGIFTALSDIILSNGGTVYGCVLNDQFEAIHIRAVTEEERNRMRGSKYIQSDIGKCYSLCATDLKNGLLVLFSGTPCQIDGLNCFLDTMKINRKQLVTVEILCHAVASPKVWKKFLEYRSNGKKIDKVDFRDKKNFGWEAHKETVTIEGKEISSTLYTDLFYKELLAPEHCYYCHYKQPERYSDITIADYWHINELDKDFNDNKGVSLVMINSEIGAIFFNKCKSQIDYKEFPFILSIQKPFQENYTIPSNRDTFFADLDDLPFDELHKKYTQKLPPPKLSFMKKVRRRIFYYIEKVIMIGRK